MNVIGKWKKNKFCKSSALFCNLYGHDRKFPFVPLFGGRKHRGNFNFFSESELGCGPQDSVGKFSYTFYFKRVDGNKREKVKKKKTRIHFDKTNCKLVWTNAENIRISWTNCMFTLQNIANLQGNGFTLDFGFKIYRDLTKSAHFQFEFTRCVCLRRLRN